jgi:hypothetical protein
MTSDTARPVGRDHARLLAKTSQWRLHHRRPHGRRRADHHPQVVIFAMSGKNILPGPVLMMT